MERYILYKREHKPEKFTSSNWKNKYGTSEVQNKVLN